MSRSQLPLNALRAFEAAARHASFTHAAEELHVTQAAVSHQVKALEERLGVALFVRRPRGLEITSEGEALLPDLRDAFDRMTNALERVGRKANSGTLNVSLVTTFALGWLAPRLHRFQAKHPEIEVRMTTALRRVDFAREDFDWDDELRVMIEERASQSPDALTGMEANLRFAGPETMETKIFGRLTAWQNWIFQRPNAVGEQGALKLYGTGVKPGYVMDRI